MKKALLTLSAALLLGSAGSRAAPAPAVPTEAPPERLQQSAAETAPAAQTNPENEPAPAPRPRVHPIPKCGPEQELVNNKCVNADTVN
jgi:hypothetical protein